ncbi:MAG TPA: DUF4097 family beta strand repeat-containing protein [Nannocystis sp.]|jgi:hypothetical protein
MSRSRLAARVLPLGLLLASACGVVIYDTSSRVLILEPVERMVFDSDSGAVEVFAFNRTAISLFYYLTGFETGIADVGHELDGEALRAVIACEGDDLCQADFYAEVPLGTAIEIRAASGDVKLTGVDAEVTAVVTAGAVEGVGLDSPTFSLEVGTGAVTLAWDSPPMTLNITVAAGDVSLTLPPGSYQCDFTTADGAVESQGITCDPAAAATLKISVDSGDIHLQGTAP